MIITCFNHIKQRNINKFYHFMARGNLKYPVIYHISSSKIAYQSKNSSFMLSRKTLCYEINTVQSPCM